jgi:hypothetical protein
LSSSRLSSNWANNFCFHLSMMLSLFVHEKTLNKTLGTSWKWQIWNVWKNQNDDNLYDQMACYHVVVNECFVQITPFMIGFKQRETYYNIAMCGN